MNISLIFYLAELCENISTACVITIILLAVILIASVFAYAYFRDNYDEDNQKDKKALAEFHKFFKWLFICLSVFIFVGIVIPSKQTVLLMAITNKGV